MAGDTVSLPISVHQRRAEREPSISLRPANVGAGPASNGRCALAQSASAKAPALVNSESATEAAVAASGCDDNKWNAGYKPCCALRDFEQVDKRCQHRRDMDNRASKHFNRCRKKNRWFSM